MRAGGSPDLGFSEAADRFRARKARIVTSESDLRELKGAIAYRMLLRQPGSIKGPLDFITIA